MKKNFFFLFILISILNISLIACSLPKKETKQETIKPKSKVQETCEAGLCDEIFRNSLESCDLENAFEAMTYGVNIFDIRVNSKECDYFTNDYSILDLAIYLEDYSKLKSILTETINTNIISSETIKHLKESNNPKIIELLVKNTKNSNIAYLASDFIISTNNKELLSYILDYDIQLNFLLDKAIKNNNFEIFKELLSNEDKISKGEIVNYIYESLESGKDMGDFIQKFVNLNNQYIDLEDSYGNTLLIYAVKLGNVELVKYLVDNGADVNHINLKNETSYDLTFTYLDKYYNISELVDKYTLIGTCLIRKDPDTHSRGRLLINIVDEFTNATWLPPAAIDDYVKAMNMLLDDKVNINVRGREGKTALDYAFENRGAAAKLVIPMLMNNGFETGEQLDKRMKLENDPTIDWNKRFVELISKNKHNYNIKNDIKQALKHNVDINQFLDNGNTPLMNAILNDPFSTYGIAKMLVEAGADIDKANKKKLTNPLMMACSYKNINLVIYLIEKGAKINTILDNLTALDVSQSKFSNSPEISNYLAGKGAKHAAELQ